jgi:hypothetical protein
MFSTSVQHGGGGAGNIFNKSFKEGMSEQDLIKAIYAERGTKFGSSTAGVRASVQNRFAQEQQLALGLVGQPAGSTTVASKTNVPNSTATPTQTQTTVASKTEVPKSAAPSSQAAQTAVAKATEPPPTTVAKTTQQASTGQPKQVQESAESLLASLNNKMDQLINISAKTSTTNERQLRSTEAMSGDLFLAA